MLPLWGTDHGQNRCVNSNIIIEERQRSDVSWCVDSGVCTCLSCVCVCAMLCACVLSELHMGAQLAPLV